MNIKRNIIFSFEGRKKKEGAKKEGFAARIPLLPQGAR